MRVVVVVVVASLKWCPISETTGYSGSGRALRRGRGSWRGGVSYTFFVEMRVVVVASLKWCPISETTGYSGATQGEGFEGGLVVRRIVGFRPWKR